MSAAQALPREELLRAGALAMTKWRGKSGRSYVCAIWNARTIDADEMIGAVVIRVSRDRAGHSENRGVSVVTGIASARALIGKLPAAVSELHLHRICESDDDRNAAASDLKREP